MAIILKNQTALPISIDIGETVPGNGQLDVTHYTVNDLRQDITLEAALLAADIILNDGTVDIIGPLPLDNIAGTLLELSLSQLSDVGGVPTNGDVLAFNSTSGTWEPAVVSGGGGGSKLVQIAVGNILVSSGTTQIPKDSSIPQVTEGTEIWSQTITPTVITNTIRINTNVTASMSEKQEEIVFTVFRNSVCIGTVLQNIPRKKSGFVVSFSVTDLPNTLSPVTYSVRVGRSDTAGVWYINDIHNTPNAFGGTLINNGYSVEELEVI